MSTLNEENLVSVDDINEAIGNFIGKHPENVTTWIDGKTVTIQLSNIGVRDKLFSRLAYLVENTTIENDLSLFNMPAKCVYASNQIIRFTCTINELDSCVKDYNNPPMDQDYDPSSASIEFPIKKFYNRLTRSSALKKAQTIINKSSHKIKVYIIGDPEEHKQDENDHQYVTWTVIDIIEIDANTTWNDGHQEISDLFASKGRKVGDFGAFNILLNGRATDNSKIVNDVYIGQLPEFVFDSSIKVGDVIDSRDYVNDLIWIDEPHYQTSYRDYQDYSDFEEQYLLLKGNDIDIKPYGETLIPDGAIIII